jgi:hypothetical protein
MSGDIYTLARRAGTVTKARGFLRCWVESESERIIAFEFDTTEHARAFSMTRSRARISNDRETVVLAEMS